MHFLLFSKTNPLQVLQQGPYGGSCPFTGPFAHISQITHKNFLIKEIFPLLLKALGKERPSMLPKSGAPMETDAHLQSLTQHILRGSQ